jgi:hypothetical protein
MKKDKNERNYKKCRFYDEDYLEEVGCQSYMSGLFALCKKCPLFYLSKKYYNENKSKEEEVLKRDFLLE